MLALILLVFSLLANLIVGLFAYVKNPRARLNQLLALLVVSMSEWILANYLANFASPLTLFWNRASFVGPLYMVLSAYLFVFYISGRRHFERVQWFVVAGTIVTSLLSVSPYGIPSIVAAYSGRTIVGYVPALSIGYFVLIAWIVLMALVTVVALAMAFRGSRGLNRAQLRIILWGIAVGAFLSVLTNVVLPLIDGSTASYNYAPLSTLVITGAFAYSIIRHRFLDVRAAVARSVAYVLLVGSLALTFGLVAFLVTSISFSRDVSRMTETTVYTLLSVVLAFVFQPLRVVFERLTNRLFYKESYNTQEVIDVFSKMLVSELNLEHILKKSLTVLCESIHVEFGQIIVFHNDRVFRIEHYGPLPRRLMVAPELRRLNRSMLIADELGEGERKRTLDQHGIRLSMMLSTREQFVGYLLLGNKLSGDIYTAQDVKLLDIAGSELAVAILNAKAFVEIQEFNTTLQARIDHATNRLRTANRHLKELDHAKDEFISMASHQLRTPLTTIKGYLSMMLEGDAGKMNESQKQFVGYAFDASERMVNLISDLLNVSRLSAGKFLIQTKPTDMVAMIQDEVRQLQSHAKAKNISLIFEPPKHPLQPAEVDDNKTRQVVMNFIDNAIYYTAQGEVRVVLEQTGDSVRLEVRDTGIGVPQAAKKKLFSKFFRAENAQSVRPDGTGLGLYLARRVIQDQGGTIIFSSVEGKGSTFGFILPLKPPPAKHEEHHGRKLVHK